MTDEVDVVSTWKSHGGKQLLFEHASRATGTRMECSLYLPPDCDDPPVVYYLSGLTCTWENVTTKGGFQAVASELGVAVVAPDTSPRGPEVHDVDRWDLGTGAGFYVDADAEPWSSHYQMYTYAFEELPATIEASFPVADDRRGAMGHSMGGHGALVAGLREPDRFRSVSALAPVVHPSVVQWGEDAFGAYLRDRSDWSAYDATELVETHARPETTLRIDQGTDDEFLESQLRPHLFAEACEAAGQPLELHRRPGYDHSYYFVSTFMADHLSFHADRLFA